MAEDRKYDFTLDEWLDRAAGIPAVEQPATPLLRDIKYPDPFARWSGGQAADGPAAEATEIAEQRLYLGVDDWGYFDGTQTHDTDADAAGED